MREGADAATVDLPGFLQTELEGEEKILLKLIDVVAFLLVESDSSERKKHLRRDNCK